MIIQFQFFFCGISLLNIRWLHETWPLGLRPRSEANGKLTYSINILICLHKCNLPSIYKGINVEYAKEFEEREKHINLLQILVPP